MKKWTAMIMVVVILLFSVAMAEAKAMYAYTAYATCRVNLREGPSTCYKIVTVVPHKKAVKVVGAVDNWLQVEYEGKEGYIRQDLLSVGTEEAYTGTHSVSYEGYTTCKLNLREGPDTSYHRLDTLPENAKVKVVGIAVDWLQVEYQGEKGYVCAKYIRTEEKKKVSSQEYVTTARVHMRMGPGTCYDSLTILRKGAEVKVTKQSGKWYLVEYKECSGYVFSAYLAKKE